MASPDFNSWLESLPRQDGFASISPVRPYAHAEEAYDAQYGVVTPHPEEGAGACALLTREGLDQSGPAIEIGCGTGHLTTGLALHYPGSALLVTDPSTAFLRLTSRRLEATPHLRAPRHYAVLNGDDLGLLPAGLFSLIALRSTLHHILDVERFLAACARALRPGGTLAMGAEPCESGYILMGAVAQAIPATLAAAGIELTPEWRRQWQLFGDTMRFYCRRDLDKAAAEDKHLFRVHELGEVGARHGLRLRYHPNAAFADFAAADPAAAGRHVRFGTFFPNYLRYCMGFDPAFVALITTHLQAQFAYIDDCYASHPGPLFTGVFLLTKSA